MDWLWEPEVPEVPFTKMRPHQEAVDLCSVFYKDPSSAPCVSGSTVGLGEQGGITEQTGSQALKGGDSQRSPSELGEGWSPEPLPAPHPECETSGPGPRKLDFQTRGG